MIIDGARKVKTELTTPEKIAYKNFKLLEVLEELENYNIEQFTRITIVFTIIETLLVRLIA